MKNPIYLNHDYRTRDGHEVHIINTSTVVNLPYPVVGDMTVDGLNEPYVWTRTGCFDKDARNHPYDLVEDVGNK
jgi:hypothetical protein